MAVASANLRHDQRGGTIGGVGESDVARHYLVKTTARTDDEQVIAAYFATVLGIFKGSQHPNNGLLKARDLDCQPISGAPLAWDVVVNYDDQDDDDDDDQEPNPLNRKTKISWAAEFVQVFTDEDKDGNAMLNDAGYPMDAIEVDDVRWTINLRKNFVQPPFWVTEYCNTVNSSKITVQGLTCEARTLKFNSLSIGEEQTQNDVTYVEVNASVSYNPKTWDLKRINVSIYDINGKRITDADGEKVVEPWPIGTDGLKISTPTTSNVVYKTFRRFDEKDFNNLPF